MSLNRALVVAAALVVVASPSHAAFIRVTHFVDDFAIDRDTNGTCTLREALRAANTNTSVDACPSGSPTLTDHILVVPGTHVIDLASGNSEDFALTGDLDVRESVIIRGATKTFSIVDGSGVGVTDRLFHIHATASVVAIERVALRGGTAADVLRRGGVIRNVSDDVTLEEVEVSGGTADIGGGIYNEGDLVIRRSVITGNQTVVDAGSTNNRGGGIATNGTGSALTISDSKISGNQADDDGGGLWGGTTSGAVRILRCRILDNTATDKGGGLYLSDTGYLVDYSEVARNQADIAGGLYLTAMGDVEHSAILDNTATTLGGGLVFNFDGFLRFSTVSGNAAPVGAGVYAEAGMALFDADTIARNLGDGVHNVNGAFFENTLIADHAGGNCTGAVPMFGAFNLEDTNTCGFVSSAGAPNLPNTNPLLGTLGSYGGPTPTIALLPGSPAIDVVTSEIRDGCEDMLDQRGYGRGRPRTIAGFFLCDLGAVEVTTPFVVDDLADAVDDDLADDLCATATSTCTLRAAIQQANANIGMNEIDLGPGSHLFSLGGQGEDAALTGDLDIDPPIWIRGAGSGATTVDAGSLDRVFEVGSSVPVITSSNAPRRTTFEDLTIRGGSGPSRGAGILTHEELRLDRVELSNNSASQVAALDAPNDIPIEIFDSTARNNAGGRAIFAQDARIERSSLTDNTSSNYGAAGDFIRLRLTNSTVSGNDAGSTGAIFASEAIVDSSTIVDNTADFAPGGLFLLELSVFRNSIIADNLVTGVPDNCVLNPAAVTSLGFNVTDTNTADCTLDDASDQVLTAPLLGSLADNGGPTLTHLLLAGSPAIDMGDPANCPTTDQRGFLRPGDGEGNGSFICDAGAIEVPEPNAVLSLLAGIGLLRFLKKRRDQS